jgi:hypothetical protein
LHPTRPVTIEYPIIDLHKVSVIEIPIGFSGFASSTTSSEY